jgi:hypothetical protein
MSTSLFSPTGFGAGSFVNAVATRKSRECAVGSATNYLWFCVSPQDENFQGKPVRPLFSINSLLVILSDYWRKKKKEIQRKDRRKSIVKNKLIYKAVCWIFKP